MIDTNARRLAELAPKIMSAFHDLGRQHPADAKLSMRQFQALLLLSVNKRLSLSAMCEKLSLAPSTGTELANRLISMTYIKKEGESTDRRQQILSLTQKGVELVHERQKILSEMFSKFLAPFTVDDKEGFVNAFEDIYLLIEKYHRKQTL